MIKKSLSSGERCIACDACGKELTFDAISMNGEACDEQSIIDRGSRRNQFKAVVLHFCSTTCSLEWGNLIQKTREVGSVEEETLLLNRDA